MNQEGVWEGVFLVLGRSPAIHPSQRYPHYQARLQPADRVTAGNVFLQIVC